MLEDLPSVREQLDKANISEPRLRFRDDRLTASVRVPMYGEIAARVSLVGRVRPDNGGLAFETESVSFGSLPAPGPVREALDTQVRAALQRFNREFKGRVDEVIATEGTLILRGEKPS